MHLPRPSHERPSHQLPGLYFRVGRNQHRDLLDVLGEGERGFFGIIIDAHYADRRHRELRLEALRCGFDVILDPKSHAMALPGSHTGSLAELPWGLDRHHTAADFEGADGRMRAELVVQFALEHNFTQLHGLTHLLTSANDRWLRRDIETIGWTRDALGQAGSSMPLIYPLALPLHVLRDPLERQAIIGALEDAPFDALWLRVENFGSDASGEKTAAYIQACREFHTLDRRLIADHVGGLPGLGLLAFSAVGGLSHGITLLETFKASHWRRPPTGQNGGSWPTRIYIPRLDMLMKREQAEAFLNSSTRTRSRFGCRDTHCCPGGISDMLDRPARHFVHQRSEEIARIGRTPASLKVATYLDQFVRSTSDNVAAASGLGAITDETRERMRKKQAVISRYRDAMTHLAEVDSISSAAEPPLPRSAREE